MRRALRPVIGTWLLLMLLLAAEFGVSFLPFRRVGPVVIVATGAAMVVVVGFAFMHLRRASGLAQMFALAGIFWLLVLMTLGSMDPLTRTDYPVPVTRYP